MKIKSFYINIFVEDAFNETQFKGIIDKFIDDYIVIPTGKTYFTMFPKSTATRLMIDPAKADYVYTEKYKSVDDFISAYTRYTNNIAA